MNNSNLRKLINYINGSNSFSMHSWHWGEGSMKYYFSHTESTYLNGREKFKKGEPACIGGHFMTMEGFDPGFYYAESIEKGLAKFLDIEWTIANEMTTGTRAKKNPGYEFRGNDSPFEKGYVTKDRAIAMLNNFESSNKIDWSALRTHTRMEIEIGKKEYKNRNCFVDMFRKSLEKKIPNVQVDEESLNILNGADFVIGNIREIADEVFYLGKSDNCKLKFPLRYWTEIQVYP